MISPVSKPNISMDIPATEIKLYSSTPRFATSSLCSLQPISLIKNFFVWIWNFLKMLCCCEEESFSKEIPEVDPLSLSQDDPFRNLIFTADGSFCSPIAFKETTKLFRFLGTRGYFSWIANLFWLQKKEKEVKAFRSHPLELLYYLFYNKDHTRYIVNLKKQAYEGRWILRLKAGKDPWEEFIAQQIADIKKHSDCKYLLPGFCKALCLDEVKAMELAEKEKWREFLLFIYTERQAHFHL